LTYRSGFVSIIGCPNVGKSTLLNRLVGQKIAIVADKAQTTRNRITGVLTRDDYQIVFLDTPGMTTPKNRLGSYMQRVATQATRDVEAILFVVDPTARTHARDRELLQNFVGANSPPLRGGKAAKPTGGSCPPILILLNKSDAATPVQLANAEDLARQINPAWPIFAISALTGAGVPELEAALLPLMPLGPQYFPPDMVTDQPERQICAELIREKALQSLREEIPHGIGVGLDKMALRESDGGTVPLSPLMDVWATIYCERDSHKGILIGKGGSMLKKIGTEARRDIEWLLGVRINLQLWVKVKDDWRNKPSMLAELGYTIDN